MYSFDRKCAKPFNKSREKSYTMVETPSEISVVELSVNVLDSFLGACASKYGADVVAGSLDVCVVDVSLISLVLLGVRLLLLTMYSNISNNHVI